MRPLRFVLAPMLLLVLTAAVAAAPAPLPRRSEIVLQPGEYLFWHREVGDIRYSFFPNGKYKAVPLGEPYNGEWGFRGSWLFDRRSHRLWLDLDDEFCATGAWLQVVPVRGRPGVWELRH